MNRGYAWARTLLAGATLLTLLAERADTLFRPLGVEVAREVTDIPFMKVSLFTLLHGDHLEAARWIAIAILALTATGWRPRVTGVLHWYVTASFAVSCVVVEGGDQAAAILTLLLIPVTLLDGRGWHWSPPRAAGETATMVRGACRGLVRLQMAVIYFTACTSKVAVPEWANGTAVYYWSMHPIFGVEGWRRALLLPIVTNPVGVTCLTWGAMTIEAFLFMGLLMERRYRPVLFVVGTLFHAGIAAMHGLPSFSLVMVAGLALYLLPWEGHLTASRPVWQTIFNNPAAVRS